MSNIVEPATHWFASANIRISRRTKEWKKVIVPDLVLLRHTHTQLHTHSNRTREMNRSNIYTQMERKRDLTAYMYNTQETCLARIFYAFTRCTKDMKCHFHDNGLSIVLFSPFGIRPSQTPFVHSLHFFFFLLEKRLYKWELSRTMTTNLPFNTITKTALTY